MPLPLQKTERDRRNDLCRRCWWKTPIDHRRAYCPLPRCIMKVIENGETDKDHTGGAADGRNADAVFGGVEAAAKVDIEPVGGPEADAQHEIVGGAGALAD